MARQELARFYQKVKAKEPAFSVQQDNKGFTCTLDMPAVALEIGSFADQHFVGHGRNKKAAILAAAEQGLAFLRVQPAFQGLKPSSRLYDVLAKLLDDEVFAPYKVLGRAQRTLKVRTKTCQAVQKPSVYSLTSLQGLRKEPEVEGNLILAQKYDDGWLPIQHLLQSRAVMTWLKQQPDAPLQDIEALTGVLQQQLRTEGMPNAGEPPSSPTEKRGIPLHLLGCCLSCIHCLGCIWKRRR